MKPTIKDELLDELLKNYSQPSDLLGPDGLLTELKMRLINRVLDSELTHHLGYEKHQTPKSIRLRPDHRPTLATDTAPKSSAAMTDTCQSRSRVTATASSNPRSSPSTSAISTASTRPSSASTPVA